MPLVMLPMLVSRQFFVNTTALLSLFNAHAQFRLAFPQLLALSKKCSICLLRVPLAAVSFVSINHCRMHNNSPSMTNQQRYRSNTQELSFIDSGDPFLHLSLRITANTTDQNLVCSLQRPFSSQHYHGRPATTTTAS